MTKKVTNKDYETTDVTIEELPGGDNVRIGFSRGMSLDYGSRKVDFHYSADFKADEVTDAYDRIEKYITARVRNAITTEV